MDSAELSDNILLTVQNYQTNHFQLCRAIRHNTFYKLFVDDLFDKLRRIEALLSSIPGNSSLITFTPPPPPSTAYCIHSVRDIADVN